MCRYFYNDEIHNNLEVMVHIRRADIKFSCAICVFSTEYCSLLGMMTYLSSYMQDIFR